MMSSKGGNRSIRFSSLFACISIAAFGITSWKSAQIPHSLSTDKRLLQGVSLVIPPNISESNQSQFNVTNTSNITNTSNTTNQTLDFHEVLGDPILLEDTYVKDGYEESNKDEYEMVLETNHPSFGLIKFDLPEDVPDSVIGSLLRLNVANVHSCSGLSLRVRRLAFYDSWHEDDAIYCTSESLLDTSIIINAVDIFQPEPIEGLHRIGVSDFYISKDLLSWSDHLAQAESFGMTLASVRSKEEQKLIFEFMASDENQDAFGVWTGGKRNYYNPLQWEWVDGYEFKFTNWAPGQPSNNGMEHPFDQDRLMLGGPGFWPKGVWHDKQSAHKRYALYSWTEEGKSAPLAARHCRSQAETSIHLDVSHAVDFVQYMLGGVSFAIDAEPYVGQRGQSKMSFYTQDYSSAEFAPKLEFVEQFPSTMPSSIPVPSATPSRVTSATPSLTLSLAPSVTAFLNISNTTVTMNVQNVSESSPATESIENETAEQRSTPANSLNGPTEPGSIPPPPPPPANNLNGPTDPGSIPPPPPPQENGSTEKVAEERSIIPNSLNGPTEAGSIPPPPPPPANTDDASADDDDAPESPSNDDDNSVNDDDAPESPANTDDASADDHDAPDSPSNSDHHSVYDDDAPESPSDDDDNSVNDDDAPESPSDDDNNSVNDDDAPEPPSDDDNKSGEGDEDLGESRSVEGGLTLSFQSADDDVPEPPPRTPNDDCIVENPSWLGDGLCDVGFYSSEECQFDQGDCIPQMRSVGDAIEGDFKYREPALAFDGSIYAMPSSANRILKLDPVSGVTEFVGDDQGGDDFKFSGTVGGLDGNIYGIPNQANYILKYDPFRDFTSRVAEDNEILASPVQHQFSHGVASTSTGSIYFIPYFHEKVVKFNPFNIAVPLVEIGDDFGSDKKWWGGVEAGDNNIYAIPGNGGKVLKIDVLSDTAELIGENYPETYSWMNGALASDGNIYACPYDAPQILQININTQTTSLVGPDLGNDPWKWSGFVEGSDGFLYGIPKDSNTILRFDPVTKAASRIPLDRAVSDLRFGKWQSGVLANDDTIYAIPYSEQKVLAIPPLSLRATEAPR